MSELFTRGVRVAVVGLARYAASGVVEVVMSGRTRRLAREVPDRAQVDLRSELEQSIRAICEAVAGDACVVDIGYSQLRASSFDEHRFYVVVDRRIKGALIGRDGKTAHNIRELVKTRASVLGRRDPVDVRIIGYHDEAPPGVFEEEEATAG